MCWHIVTLDQTVKTIAKFLYGGYISIFGALARILSNRGASFTSNVTEELCKILGIKQLQTMPYHPQSNRLVERSHQMIGAVNLKPGDLVLVKVDAWKGKRKIKDR